MNIGSIGRVLASQAVETTKKSVIDAVMPPDPKSRMADSAGASKPAGAPDIGAIVLGQIQAMQRPLGEDRELQVSLSAAQDVLLVHEIFVPHGAVLVFSGLDPEGNVMRVILPADHVQLVCKIVPVMPGHPARRINIIQPKTRAAEGVSGSPSQAPAQAS